MAIYLDNNATTPLRPEVWEAMAQVEFGGAMLRNPSSLHRAGLAAQKALAAAREQVAAVLGARRAEIIFTGGGSEAINLALKGALWAQADSAAPGALGLRRASRSAASRPHVVSSAIEHHAVLHALEWLEAACGVEVTLVPVDARGVVDPEAVREALTDRTVLVSVMHVNNEVGAVQPVAAIGRLCHERGILFHVDAVQSAGKLPVGLATLECDLLSCSAHKLGGPKGVGALAVREGTPLVPLVHGGPQEGGLRAGTENVQGIVGFGVALTLAEAEREANWARWLSLRQAFYSLPRKLPAVRLNSDPAATLPNCVNLSFLGCDGMTLAMSLSAKGIYVSTGSACNSTEITPSHVLKAMGLSDAEASSALRFSMGRDTSDADVLAAVAATEDAVHRVRTASGAHKEAGPAAG